MTIIRWKMRPELENYVGRNLYNHQDSNMNEDCGCLPDTNILKYADHYRIEVAAPGLNKKDFNIELKEDVLTVSYTAADNSENSQPQAKYLRHEFETESFTRHFTLPETTDSEKIAAKYENGVLSIHIPFEDPEKNRITKSISIN